MEREITSDAGGRQLDVGRKNHPVSSRADVAATLDAVIGTANLHSVAQATAQASLRFTSASSMSRLAAAIKSVAVAVDVSNEN
jgi:hypothetical protein